MNDEVDLAPLFFEIVEDGVDTFEIGDVAVAGHEGVQFLGEGFDTLAQGITLPRQCDVRARVTAGLSDTPCDGTVVCDAHDDAALACHEAGTLNHVLFP